MLRTFVRVFIRTLCIFILIFIDISLDLCYNVDYWGNYKKTTKDYGDDLMKLLVLLLLIIPVKKFLQFIFLDIFDDFLVNQKRQRKSRKPVTYNETYEFKYKKAQ